MPLVIKKLQYIMLKSLLFCIQKILQIVSLPSPLFDILNNNSTPLDRVFIEALNGVNSLINYTLNLANLEMVA